MYVKGIVPGMTTKTFVVPNGQSGFGAVELDRLANAIDAKGLCRDADLREAVAGQIAAGNIIVLPEELVWLIGSRLRRKGLHNAHLKPEISRTLGSDKFWPTVTRELIVLVAPYRLPNPQLEAWLAKSLDLLLDGWIETVRSLVKTSR